MIDEYVIGGSGGGADNFTGDATVTGGHGEGDTIFCVDDIPGSSFANNLAGYDSTFDGRAVSNIIDSGAGDDTIDGKGDDDSLTGGAGNDEFIYQVGDGHDTITDFNFGISGTLSDGDSTNNEFIDLSGFYDNLSELYVDQADDGALKSYCQIWCPSDPHAAA